MAPWSRLILLLTFAGTASACAGPAFGSAIQPGAPAASAEPTVSVVAALPRSAGAIVVAPDGTVYLEQRGCLTWSDNSGYGSEAPQVLKLTAGAKLIAIAGLACGFGGDGGPATRAKFHMLSGMALDHTGNLFVADLFNDRVREISSQGRVSTVTGSGPVSDDGAANDVFGGDGGPANRAQLARPAALAIDARGVLYIADQWNNRVRKMSPDGRISTVAGTGVKGNTGDGGLATSAQLWYPESLAVNAAGDLFIADQAGTRLRVVDSHGTITTVAASTYAGAPAAPLHFGHIVALAVGPDQSMLIGDVNQQQVFRLTPDRSSLDGMMNPGWRCPGSCKGFAPHGLAFDPAGDVYVVDAGDRTLIKLTWKH
jgi:DNA-binding beta-propeller fold protein YncE